MGLLTPDGTLLDANRASMEFAGSSRQDVIGRPFWETVWFASTPGAPEAVREGIVRAAAGEFVRYELSLRRPSGAVITFDFSLHPVRNEKGEVVYIVPEGRDVTERKSAELRDSFLIRLDDRHGRSSTRTKSWPPSLRRWVNTSRRIVACRACLHSAIRSTSYPITRGRESRAS